MKLWRGREQDLEDEIRDYVDFRDRTRSFDGLVAFTISTFGFGTRPDALRQLKGRHAGDR